MSHHTRVRASVAAWSSGAVTPAEFEKLDANQFASINGDAGGVWAPTSVITIGGAGIELPGGIHGALDLDGNLEVTGDITVSDDVFIGDQLHVTGLAVLDGTTTVNADFVCTGSVNLGNTLADTTAVSGDLNVDGDADIDGTLTIHQDLAVTDDIDCDDLLVRGNLTAGNAPTDTFEVVGTSLFNGDVVIEDDLQIGTSAADTCTFEAAAEFNADVQIGASEVDTLTVESISHFNGDAFFNDHVTLGSTEADLINILGSARLNQPLAFAGTGRVPHRFLAGPSTTTTVAATDANFVHIASAASEPTYTILDTSAGPGDCIIFVKTATNGAVHFTGPGISLVSIGATERKVILAYRVTVGQWQIVTWAVGV